MKVATDHFKLHFEREGYVVLPGFLDAALTASIRTAVYALCTQISRHPEQWSEEVVYQRECLQPQLAHLSGNELAEARAQIYIVGNLTHHVPEVRHLLLSRPVVEIAEAALGEAVDFHFSSLTLRAARLGCSNAWHRDFPNRFCCGADERQLRLLVCLDGMSEKQGAVRVAPGSHRWTDAHWESFKSGSVAEAAADVRKIACPPGSVVVLGCRTAHAVLPNVSEQPRANLIAQYGALSNPLVVGAAELEGTRAL